MTSEAPRSGRRWRLVRNFVLAAFGVCLLVAALDTLTSAPAWVTPVLFGALFGFVGAPTLERWKALSARQTKARQAGRVETTDDPG